MDIVGYAILCIFAKWSIDGEVHHNMRSGNGNSRIQNSKLDRLL